MTEYLITFNDEWVPDHTEEELREKGAARPVIEEMLDPPGDLDVRDGAGLEPDDQLDGGATC